MKKLFVILILLILIIPGTALAIDVPTSAPPVPEETPELPEELPELPEETPELPEDFDFSALGISFDDIMPVFASYETLPAERTFAPDSFDAIFYSSFSAAGSNTTLSFNDNETLDFSFQYTSSDSLGNTWSHEMNMSLFYDKQAFLDESDAFLAGSFIITSSLNDFTASISGNVSSQYIYFEDEAPLEELKDKNLIMLTQHIEDIEGWPSVDVDNLVCFLDPMDAFLEQIIAAAAEIIENVDEQEIAGEIGEAAPEYTEKIEEAVETETRTSSFPSPADPVQVAIGGSITALLLAFSGISANLSGSGAAGASCIAGTSATNTAQQAEGICAAVQSTATQAAQNAVGPNIAGATGLISSIKSFFAELFINLRNMLTDEGRSFASGKVSETLKKGQE